VRALSFSKECSSLGLQTTLPDTGERYSTLVSKETYTSVKRDLVDCNASVTVACRSSISVSGGLAERRRGTVVPALQGIALSHPPSPSLTFLPLTIIVAECRRYQVV